MLPPENVDNLRSIIKNPSTTAEGVETFARLLAHPDLRWRDIIDALNFKVMVAEQAALILHSQFKIPRKGEEIIKDKHFWKKVLNEKGIGMEDKCGPFAKIVQKNK